MSLQRRRERAIILHVWKILNNYNPNSVNMEFKYHDRSTAIKAVVKPLPKLRGKILTIFDESFAVKSAKLWNILPSMLTKITSLDSFKTNLDKFLFEISDEPPLPGYSHKTNNSLTSLCSVSKCQKYFILPFCIVIYTYFLHIASCFMLHMCHAYQILGLGGTLLLLTFYIATCSVILLLYYQLTFVQ